MCKNRILLAVVAVLGVALVIHQVNLRQRMQVLQVERDSLATDLQTHSQQLEEMRATLLKLKEAPEAGDFSNALQTQAKLAALESQVQNLSRALAQRPSGPRFPEYDPNQPPSDTTPTIAATNSVPKRNWGPEQVMGTPDTERSGDLPTAWASLEPDVGAEWLWVDFEQAVAVSAVRIRESFNPGAISKVTARVGGQEVVLWEGTATGGQAPRDFVVPVNQNVVAQSVVVYLDSGRVAGWNEIDAVELIGRDGSRQWAASANASSTYAERPASQESTSREYELLR